MISKEVLRFTPNPQQSTARTDAVISGLVARFDEQRTQNESRTLSAAESGERASRQSFTGWPRVPASARARAVFADHSVPSASQQLHTHMHPSRTLPSQPHTLDRSTHSSKQILTMGTESYTPPATDLITLTRHVLNDGFEAAKSRQASGDLTILLTSLQTTW